MSKRYRVRGLSPIIAAVIIVVAALAIGVAVVGWFTGIFSGLTSGQEQLRLYPSSKLYDNSTLILKLANTGSKDAVIYELTTSIGDDITDFSSAEVSDQCSVTSDGKLVVPAGASCVVKLTLPGNYEPGTRYTITVYTEAQYSYSIDLVARKS